MSRHYRLVVGLLLLPLQTNIYLGLPLPLVRVPLVAGRFVVVGLVVAPLVVVALVGLVGLVVVVQGFVVVVGIVGSSLGGCSC